jgi:hypothetical protein
VQVACTQCGAALEVAPDDRLLVCSFCATALVVDGSQTLFHELMRPTVAAAAAPAHLRRFLASGATVANLERDARIADPVLELFPFWAFTIATEAGDKVVLEPAAPSSLQGLQGLGLPPGESVPASPESLGTTPCHAPEVPLATARQWLVSRHGDATVTRTVLYHLPFYRFTYTYRGATYSAAVDAVAGHVLPAAYPAKAETPYVLVTVLAVALFLLEGLLFWNPFVKLLAYLVTAPPLLAVAWLTSRKV